MKRLKSKWLWISIIAQLIAILQFIEVVSITDIKSINVIVGGILEILVLAGVLNNPSRKKF